MKTEQRSHARSVFLKFLFLFLGAGTGLIVFCSHSALSAEEMKEERGKGVLLDFLMLPQQERIEVLKERARSGDPTYADFIAEVIAGADKEVLDQEEVFEEYVIPYLSVFAGRRHVVQGAYAIRADNVNARRYGALLLGYTAAAKAVSDLASLLDDQDDFTRRNAIRGLASPGTEKAAEVLNAFAGSTRLQQERELASAAAAEIQTVLRRRKGIPSPYPPDFSTVTPHVDWAVPLARKPRVLFLLERACLRNLVEVCQRADLDWDYVEIPSKVAGPKSRGIQPMTLREDIIEIVLDRMDKAWDAIVVESVLCTARTRSGHVGPNSRGWTGWPSFPERIQRGLLKKTAKGAGLVLINRWPDNVAGRQARLTVESGMYPWPRDVRAEKFGKGRIIRFKRGAEIRTWASVLLDLRRIFPMGDDFAVPGVPGKKRQLYPSEDFYFMGVVRAVLWASDHRFTAHIAEVSLDAFQGRPGKLSLTITGQARPGTIVGVRILNPYNENICRLKEKATTGRVTLGLPLMPAGAVLLCIWLRDRDARVINWSAFTGKVRGDLLVEKVVPEPHPVPAEGPLHARIMISGRSPLNVTVNLTGKDTFGRVIFQAREMIGPGRTVEMSFRNTRLLAKTVSLVTWLNGPSGQPISYVRQPVVVQHRCDHADIAWLNWGGDQYLDLWRKLRPDHVCALSLEVLEAGLDCATPGFTGHVPNHDPGPYSPDGIRRPCLTSAKWERQLAASIEMNMRHTVH